MSHKMKRLKASRVQIEMKNCKLCLEPSQITFELRNENEYQKNIQKLLDKHFRLGFVFSEKDIDRICLDCWQKVSDFDDFCNHLENIHQQALRADIKCDEALASIYVSSLLVSETSEEIKPTEEELEDAIAVQAIKRTDIIVLDTGKSDGLRQTGETEEAAPNCVKDGIASDFGENADLGCESEGDCSQFMHNNQSNGSLLTGEGSVKQLDVKQQEEVSKGRPRAKIIYPRRCGICHVSLETESRYRNHMRKSHADRFVSSEPPNRKIIYPRSCKLCDAVLESEGKYKRHLHSSHPFDSNGERAPIAPPKGHRRSKIAYPRRCEKCDIWLDKIKYKNHMQRLHSDQELFVCELCGHVAKDKRVHTAHYETEHMNNVYECDLCGNRFHNRLRIELHMRSIHVKKLNKQYVECNICQKKVKIRHLPRHKKIHDDNLRYLHKCFVCGKGFSDKFSLKGHESIHTGELPLKCADCDERFRFASTLSLHRKKAHKASALKQSAITLKCEFCDDVFSSAWSRHFHRKQRHPNRNITK